MNKSDIPFQTLAVNVIGAVMIGMIVQAAESYGNLNGPWLLFLKVGICGGFTTFSTFSLEALGLLQSGRALMFGIYVAAKSCPLHRRSLCRKDAGQLSAGVRELRCQ